MVKGEWEENGTHIREALQLAVRRDASGWRSSWRSERWLMSELEKRVTAGAAEQVTSTATLAPSQSDGGRGGAGHIHSYVGTKSERAALAALSRLLMDSTPLTITVRPCPTLSELLPASFGDNSHVC
jgi:hypothetical protein